MNTNRTSTRITPGLVFGLAVMAFGLVLTLDNFGLFEARRFVRLWPVLLIAVGVAQIIQSMDSRARPEGAFLVSIGVGLLLVNLSVLRFGQALALFLLGVGATMVWRVARGPGGAPSAVANLSKHLDVFALLGSVEPALSAQDFRGGTASAVLGACDINLSKASIEGGEAVINTFALWGGIEIRVPEDWTVEVRGMALLGAFEDTSRRPDDDRKKLIVTGYAVMGGVEVKN